MMINLMFELEFTTSLAEWVGTGSCEINAKTASTKVAVKVQAELSNYRSETIKKNEKM